jgi:pyruvate dehydrogenase E2 component (dihydrolipoamide acetyltransferase)
MPRLSDSMNEATVIAWLKEPGQSFARGEPLFEVETDKATVVYEAETDGVLQEILVAEGVTAALGEPIARVVGSVTDDERKSSEPAKHEEPVLPPVATTSSPMQAQQDSDGAATRPRATPVARRTAASFAIALHELTGTGPGGRIRKLDVLRAGPTATVATSVKGATTVVPLTSTRQTIAQRMAQSRSEIPSFDVAIDVDMTTLIELRRGAGEVVEAAPSLNDFVIKAAATALREFPAFNSSFVDGRIERHDRVNVGLAVATDDALLVPAVLDADRKSLPVLAAETRDLAARARERRLLPDELSAATFTVSNLGMFGVRAFNAVINPPQVAILAVGAANRAFVETDANTGMFRDVAVLTLTSDHRAVYGADAARFLARVKQLLEHPLALLL